MLLPCSMQYKRGSSVRVPVIENKTYLSTNDIIFKEVSNYAIGQHITYQTK